MPEQSIKTELKELFEEHNYNKSYNYLTVVSHTTGDNIDFYIAKANVPRKISITNKKYWKLLTTKTN